MEAIASDLCGTPVHYSHEYFFPYLVYMTDIFEQQETHFGPSTGGTIPDVNPEFAAAVRASHRKEVDSLKAGEHLDISLPDDLEFAEEGRDHDDTELRFTEDGILIEPFNLGAERSGGYFDNEDNYVARVNKDDTDAWMQAMEDSEGVVRGSAPAASMSRKSQAEADKPEMSSGDRALYKQKIVRGLRAGETVLEALRRLSTKTHSQSTNNQTKSERLAAVRSRIAGNVPAENRAAFDSLTEAAGELLGAGDASVYSKDKEALVRDIQRDMRTAMKCPLLSSTPESEDLILRGGSDAVDHALASDGAAQTEDVILEDTGQTRMDIEEKEGPGADEDSHMEDDDAKTPQKRRKTAVPPDKLEGGDRQH